MFEKAIRNKFRFYYKGQITVEDLWDLTVETLDAIYRDLVKNIKSTEDESLLAKPSKEEGLLKEKAAIVKYIVEVKLQEQEAAKVARENKAKKTRIMEVLEKKQEESLANMSEEDLQKLLASL